MPVGNGCRPKQVVSCFMGWEGSTWEIPAERLGVRLHGLGGLYIGNPGKTRDRDLSLCIKNKAQVQQKPEYAVTMAMTAMTSEGECLPC